MVDIAIIGSGPSAQGFMRGLISKLNELKQTGQISEEEIRNYHIDIFDLSRNIGYGGPYDPALTGAEHLFNGRTVSAFNLDSNDSFFQWLQDPANQESINQKFNQIFCDRFEAKFALLFPHETYDPSLFNGKRVLDVGFKDQPEYARLYDRLGEPFGNLCDHYIEDHKDIQARYLKYAGEAAKGAFLPRLAYGIFLKDLFDKTVQELKEIVGEENVQLRPQTRVEGLDADSNLIFEKDGERGGHKYDIIGAGTGRWQRDYNKADLKSEREAPLYKANAWPISEVEAEVMDVIKRAKEENKPQVRIAIEGSSLTSIDMAKTLLHNCAAGRFEEASNGELTFIPNPDLGVEVRVDLISRNGLMSLVRGNFAWLPHQVGEYYVDAIKQVAQEKGIDFSRFDHVQFTQEDNQVNKTGPDHKLMNHHLLQEYAKQSGDPQVKLSQIFECFCEIGAACYQQAGKDFVKRGQGENVELMLKKSDDMKRAAQFVRDNKDNYPAIIEGYMGLRANLFTTLQSDLNDAVIGDIDGKSIFEIVNKHFVGSTMSLPLLPEEQLLVKKYDAIAMSLDAPMPPESARELLAMNKAGVLGSTRIGYNKSMVPDLREGTVAWGDNKYDYAVNCTGTRLNFDTTRDTLYQSLTAKYDIPSDRIILTPEQYSAMRERAQNYQIDDLIGRFRETDGYYVYNHGESGMAALHLTPKNPEANEPKIILSRDLVAVSYAAKSAQKAIEKVLAERHSPAVAIGAAEATTLKSAAQTVVQTTA